MKWMRFLMSSLMVTTFAAHGAAFDQPVYQPSISIVRSKPITEYYEPNWCNPDDLSAGDQPPVPCKAIESILCEDGQTMAFYPEFIPRCTEYL